MEIETRKQRTEEARRSEGKKERKTFIFRWSSFACLLLIVLTPSLGHLLVLYRSNSSTRKMFWKVFFAFFCLSSSFAAAIPVLAKRQNPFANTTVRFVSFSGPNFQTQVETIGPVPDNVCIPTSGSTIASFLTDGSHVVKTFSDAACTAFSFITQGGVTALNPPLSVLSILPIFDRHGSEEQYYLLLRLTAPLFNTTLAPGSSQSITWDSSLLPSNASDVTAKFYYSDPSYANQAFEHVVGTAPVTSDLLNFTVPSDSTPSSYYFIGISTNVPNADQTKNTTFRDFVRVAVGSS